MKLLDVIRRLRLKQHAVIPAWRDSVPAGWDCRCKNKAAAVRLADLTKVIRPGNQYQVLCDRKLVERAS